ncbi:hypothetical protein GCM10010331_49980 [Streptomyces xanthochromogenes]|nr:hypothetical protein GCM10010331_49980 [Streptomyces xanthochromogenes]
MRYRDALIDDYGPTFQGQVFTVDDGIVCVVPRQLLTSGADPAAMREMVRGHGGDCGECRNCPLGSGS